MPAINELDRAVSGAALAPLTNRQRQDLARLAIRAWARMIDALPSSDKPKPDFDSWRHQQIVMAVERAGIRECRQEDFAQVEGHFLRLLGQSNMADRMQARAEMEPRRQALAKLRIECHAAADVIEQPEEYVSSIAERQYKTKVIDDLSPRQIWHLIFTIRSRAQKRRAKGKKSEVRGQRSEVRSQMAEVAS